MNRREAMESRSVHNLTKTVLILSEKKDLLDRYRDVQLAADILKRELAAYNFVPPC